MPLRKHAGFTLLELLVVMVLIGILVGIVAPSLAGRIAAVRVRFVTERLTADIYLARMHAVRIGSRVEIRFEWDAARTCVVRYVVREAGGADSPVLRAVDVRSSFTRGCLTMNNARRPLVFNARGMPHGIMARTIVARSGSVADTIVLSQLGRVLRVF